MRRVWETRERPADGCVLPRAAYRAELTTEDGHAGRVRSGPVLPERRARGIVHTVACPSARGPVRSRYSAPPRGTPAGVPYDRPDLESVSRELGVTAARASQWRDQFLVAGQAGLKSRVTEAVDDASRRLQAKVGELLMENEWLDAKVDHLEAGVPVARRRSTR